MQELNDAFYQAHPILTHLAGGLLVVATALCLLWGWKDRERLFNQQGIGVVPLSLAVSDYALISLLILSPLIGVPIALFDLLLVLGVLCIWRLHLRSCLVYLELSLKSLPRVIGTALILALGIYLPLQLISGAMEKLLQHLGWSQPVEPAVQLFLHAQSLQEVLPLLVLAIFAAPLAEEFLFRGLIYPAAKKFMSPFHATVLTGFLFAALHQHLPSFLPLMLLGMFLCRLFELTGSLWTGILVHAMFNGATALFLCVVKFYPPNLIKTHVP